jgi:FkbM family methyltransferase
MKKLLYISPHLSTGGLPQYLCKKIELLKNNFEIFLVEYDNITGGVLVTTRNKILKHIKPNHFFTLDNNKFKLIDIISKINPDIIHLEEIPEFFMDYELAKKIYNPKRKYFIIETSHDSSFDTNNKQFFPDKFMFVSNWQIKQYDNINIPSVLVEYPIEYVERPDRNEILRKLHLDPRKKHILHVGLFTPRKNQAEFFEYAQNFPEYEFHCVGNQADNFKYYWEPLMKNKPSNLTWWNERTDVDVFYQGMDLFLFTSKGTNNDKETMPLVIREAISYQIPTLIYNLPVYENYFDKFEKVNYLEFNNFEKNKQKIKNILDPNNQEQNMDIKDKIYLEYNLDDNKIIINNNSNFIFNGNIIIKDYLSNHTIFWFKAHLNPNSQYWAIPCPKEYFFNKIINNNNFKGYKIDFVNEIETFTKEIIIDEYATNYENTLVQNPYNCSYINYVEFFCKKYFDDYNIDDFNTVIDVGANDGLVTEWALNRGANKVYAIEPDKRSIKYLKEKFINSNKVVIVDKALYDKNEYDVKFNINNDTSTVTTLSSVSHDHSPNQDFFLSETITFSKFISDYNIDKISLLKIDIEGAEYDLLKSMSEKDKNKISYYLIECHWINEEKLNTLFEIFKENYTIEFRDHLNENKLITIDELENKEMITMFVINNNIITSNSKKEPKIIINHLLNDVNSEREIKSINSISQLSKYGEYIQHINKPYTDIPPKDNCFRPHNINTHPGGDNLTSGHYGCYKAHTDAIMSQTNSDNTIYLFFESDAIITIDVEEFIKKVKESYILTKKYGYNFFSFGPISNIDKTYDDHLSSKQMFEAHAYLIPSEKLNIIKNWIKVLEWDVFDLWLTNVCPKQRFGYYKDYMALQAEGESLIDKKLSTHNHLGIKKL